MGPKATGALDFRKEKVATDWFWASSFQSLALAALLEEVAFPSTYRSPRFASDRSSCTA